MGNNKLDILNFSKIYDDLGPEAAEQALHEVNAGRLNESSLEKMLYTSETKEEYSKRLKEQYKDA